MLGRIKDPNIVRIYFATFSLGVAYGLAVSLIAVFLDGRGFSKEAIGTLAAWFAGGIVAFSIPCGAVIRRVGAKTVLVASLAGYAATVTAFPFLDGYGAIAAVRFVDGACSVGIWVSCETILLQRAGDDDKAFVTSLYAVAIAVGYIVGPLLARGIVLFAPLKGAFVGAGVLALVTAVYVALRLEREAAPPDAVSGAEAEGAEQESYTLRGVGTLLGKIKVSCFGTFAYGYFQASVVLFLPLYLMAEKGIERDQTIIIPAFFAAGMLLFANVAGRIGDRVGHLAVMRVLGIVGMTMILGFVYLSSFSFMAAAVFVAGATLASISPLSLALQGVIVVPAEYSRATALYNAFYAAGMLLGPPISSRIFAAHGGAAMLFHLAALWVSFIAFTVFFYRDDPAASESAVETTSPAG